MTTVNGLTAERMLDIEANSIVDGDVVGDNLILTKHNGTTIDAGSVRGPQGIQGDEGPNTVDLDTPGSVLGGAWVAYVPAITSAGGSVGTGVIAGRYSKIGKTISLQISLLWGSTTAITPGAQIKFSLPFTSKAGQLAIGRARLVDVSAASSRSWVEVIVDSNVSELIMEKEGGSFNVANGDPITLANGDRIDLSVTYEAA